MLPLLFTGTVFSRKIKTDYDQSNLLCTVTYVRSEQNIAGKNLWCDWGAN